MVNVPFPKKEESRSEVKSSQLKNFEVQQDLLPPQNLEAEEAIIGGILLDPDAISRVADLVQPEAF